MRAILTLLLLSLTLVSALADRITLNSGEEIEGRILRESEEEVLVEIRVGAGIFDERRVPMEEVREIVRTPADQVAFEEIREYIALPAYSFSASEYERILQTHFRPFLAEYPDSGFAGSVQRAVEEYENEKARVEEGDLKVDGEWISREEFERNRYQITGRLLLFNMELRADGGDYLGAMRVFDRLETDAPGSVSYPDAVEKAMEILPLLERNLERLQERFEFENRQREQQLELASERRRTELEEAATAERERVEQLIKDSEEAGDRWVPPSRHSERSIKRLFDMIEKDKARLAALDLASIRRSVEISQNAQLVMELGHLDEATSEAGEALEVWPDNELASRLITEIEEKRLELAAAAEAAEAAEEVQEEGESEETEVAAETMGAEVEEPVREDEVEVETAVGEEDPTPTPATEEEPVAEPESAVVVEEEVEVSPEGSEPEAGEAEVRQRAADRFDDEMEEHEARSTSDPHFLLTIPGALTLLGVVVVLGFLVSLLSHFRSRPKEEAEPRE